jgi:inner membrane protein
MDNLTHSIAGLLLAEAVWQVRLLRGTRPPGLRKRLFATSVVGSNFPDLDFLYAPITDGKLGYLLHHRGHTHTVLAGLFTAALLYVAARAIGSRRNTLSVGDQRWLALACLLAPQLHLLMDFSNNYGVHPFWPLNGAWYYGDAIFIVEPWFWIAMLPPLMFAAERRLTAIALGAVLALALIAAWAVDIVAVGTSASLTLAALACLWLSGRLSTPRSVAFAVASSLALVIVFFSSSRSARAQLLAVSESRRLDSARTVEDVVLTPAIGNPFCVSALLVEADASRYFISTATVSTAPLLMAVDDCLFAPSTPSSPLAPIDHGTDPAVRLRAEWSGSLSELRALARDNCAAAALLRFLRVPVFRRTNAETWYLGDLRYDRGPELGFAELSIPARPSECPKHVPPWRPPRWRLLEAAR